ncbi:hypothetical protein MMC12_005877 [Toensbergia leucococca]|nr:hypothetical protein [Toensbergia leucococca]
MSTAIVSPQEQRSSTERFQNSRDTSGVSDRTLDNHRASRGETNGDEKRGDGGESGDQAEVEGEGEEEEGPPRPVGFFDKRLNKVRLQVFGLWARTTLILAVFILAVLSMYWAVLYHVEANLPALVIYVVDFDGQLEPYTGVKPLIGPMITQETQAMVDSPIPHLGYGTLPPSSFDFDPTQVRQAVYDQQAWAAIVVNANATALLQQAVEQGNSSYDPIGACQVIWVEARDQDTYYDYILPELNSLQTEITSKFGQMWTSMVLANDSIPRTTLAKVPQALSPAIGFSQFSLRPFNPPVMTPAVTIGLIYLIIIAFFSFTFFLPIHMKLIAPQGHPPLKFWQLILWRLCATILAYFFMSLAYSLISLAFMIPFNNAAVADTSVGNNPNPYGKGTFVVYWMINFVGMNALGLACENVAMIIGQPWTAFWLIFWVITNVSTSFYALELSPRFYYWGYAWPLHNIVEASRSTLFDLHSRIGLNFGVLFAWAAINISFFPFCCWFMRWKTQREKKKNA